jgi:hypothetical protein
MLELIILKHYCPSSAGPAPTSKPVIPAKAGIQASLKAFLDSRVRGNDATTKFQKFNLNKTDFKINSLSVLCALCGEGFL